MQSFSKVVLIIKAWLFICISFFSVLGFAQEAFKKGVIIDSIAVSETKSDSFALYLPQTIDYQNTHPIIFVFEPAARGRLGLTPFLESAEKHGIILVCSNDSKNGSFERNFSVVDALFNHVFKIFRVDERQMFLSGFSGGSRLATAIASMTGQFAGVIACGAGFSPNPTQRPSLNPFLYAAICGVEDMNYNEMVFNKNYLEKLGFKNTLVSFNGGHQWPNKREINRAIDWLFLNNQRTHNVQLKKEWVEEHFRQEHKLTSLFIENQELLFAKENCDRLLEDYPKNRVGADQIRTKCEELVASKSFMLASARFEAALVKENEIGKKLFRRLFSDLSSFEKTNFRWWEKEMDKLDKIEQKGDKEVKQMVARIRFGIIATIYENGFAKQDLKTNKDYKNFIEVFRQILHMN